MTQGKFYAAPSFVCESTSILTLSSSWSTISITNPLTNLYFSFYNRDLTSTQSDRNMLIRTTWSPLFCLTEPSCCPTRAITSKNSDKNFDVTDPRYYDVTVPSKHSTNWLFQHEAHNFLFAAVSYAIVHEVRHELNAVSFHSWISFSLSRASNSISSFGLPLCAHSINHPPRPPHSTQTTLLPELNYISAMSL